MTCANCLFPLPHILTCKENQLLLTDVWAHEDHASNIIWVIEPHHPTWFLADGLEW